MTPTPFFTADECESIRRAMQRLDARRTVLGAAHRAAVLAGFACLMIALVSILRNGWLGLAFFCGHRIIEGWTVPWAVGRMRALTVEQEQLMAALARLMVERVEEFRVDLDRKLRGDTPTR